MVGTRFPKLGSDENSNDSGVRKEHDFQAKCGTRHSSVSTAQCSQAVLGKPRLSKRSRMSCQVLKNSSEDVQQRRRLGALQRDSTSPPPMPAEASRMSLGLRSEKKVCHVQIVESKRWIVHLTMSSCRRRKSGYGPPEEAEAPRGRCSTSVSSASIQVELD